MADNLDEMFPARPGGMVDSHRKSADVAASAADGQGAAAVEAPDGYPAVRTAPQSPEIFQPSTVVVSTGGNAVRKILGYDANRCRATVIALDEPVVLAATRAQADDARNATNAAGQSAGGAVIPVGVPIVVGARGELYAAATSATPGRVSVIAEAYAPGGA